MPRVRAPLAFRMMVCPTVANDDRNVIGMAETMSGVVVLRDAVKADAVVIPSDTSRGLDQRHVFADAGPSPDDPDKRLERRSYLVACPDACHWSRVTANVSSPSSPPRSRSSDSGWNGWDVPLLGQMHVVHGGEVASVGAGGLPGEACWAAAR